MDRIERITKELRRHDRELFAMKQMGQVRVFRRVKRWEMLNFEGNMIGFLKEDPHLVFALTHDWTVKGRPVEWGLLPIMKKIRECDLWGRDTLADELIASYEKASARQERHIKNEAEAFAGEFHSQFKKTFSDVNVSSLDKTKRRSKWQ